jgi:hypothetical protein
MVVFVFVFDDMVVFSSKKIGFLVQVMLKGFLVKYTATCVGLNASLDLLDPFSVQKKMGTTRNRHPAFRFPSDHLVAVGLKVVWPLDFLAGPARGDINRISSLKSGPLPPSIVSKTKFLLITLV